MALVPEPLRVVVVVVVVLAAAAAAAGAAAVTGLGGRSILK